MVVTRSHGCEHISNNATTKIQPCYELITTTCIKDCSNPTTTYIIIGKELTKLVYKLAIMLRYELDENSIM